MGQLVIACYRPHPGSEERLLELTRRHVPVLRRQGLATDRPVVAMSAADGTIIEVFEWTSPEAIEKAHTNPAVLALWEEYSAVCEYLPLAALPEAQRPFAAFTPVPLD